MITAYAVMRDDHAPPALIQDRARAELYAADHHGTVHELVEKAAILRKFDAYVPADQASSLRYRVAELEAQVYADNNEILDLREQVKALQEELARHVLPEPSMTMVRVTRSVALYSARFDEDEQCDAWTGLPYGALDDLGLCT